MATRTPAPRSDLWALLGGVRLLLAMIVVAVHCQSQSGHNRVMSILQHLGAFPAVLAFLVISGFSIAHSITQRRDGYYARRFRRIYPLYALAVLAALVPSTLVGWNTAQTPKQLAYNLMFLQSFHTTAMPGNGVVWSLGVEVAFYALAPLLARLRTSTLLGIAGLSAAAFVAFPHTHLDYYSQLSRGLPFLFLGWAWLTGFIYYRVRDSHLAGLALIGAVVVLLDLNPTFLTNHSMLTVIASLAALVAGPQVRLWPSARRVLSFSGDLSYPLYLFHAPLLLTYAGHFHGQGQWFTLAWSLPLAAAMLAVDAAMRRPFGRAVDAAGLRLASAADAGRRAVADIAGAARDVIAHAAASRSVRPFAGWVPSASISVMAVAGLTFFAMAALSVG